MPHQYSVVVIGGLGRQTVHAFSNTPDGMTLTTTDPLGGTTTKTYDARGNLVMGSDGIGYEFRHGRQTGGAAEQADGAAARLRASNVVPLCGWRHGPHAL
jgi:hypothetical protein